MEKIVSIKPMLACEVDLDKLVFPLYGGTKYDGIRALVIDAKVYSRSLKLIRNKHVQNLYGHECFNGLDGELVVGDIYAPDVFQKTTSGVMSEDGIPDVKFYVFDDFTKPEQPYKIRKQSVANKVTKDGTFMVDATAELIETREDFEALLAIEAEKGGEGMILRVPSAPYKFGRATAKQGNLIKVKFFVQAEFPVVGFIEQMQNCNEAKTNELGRTSRSSSKENLVPKGTLGSLVLQYTPKLTFNCGTGFTDALRQEIWDNRPKYLKMYASVRYMLVGAKDLPRVPSFIGFRHKDDMS